MPLAAFRIDGFAEPIKVGRTSPRTPVTLSPMAFAAASNSFWRRPVTKTQAAASLRFSKQLNTVRI